MPQMTSRPRRGIGTEVMLTISSSQFSLASYPLFAQNAFLPCATSLAAHRADHLKRGRQSRHQRRRECADKPDVSNLQLIGM